MRSSGLQNVVIFEAILVMPSEDHLARPSTRLFCEFGTFWGPHGTPLGMPGGPLIRHLGHLWTILDPWGNLWDHLGLFEPSEGVESSNIGPKLGPKSGSGRASRFFSGGVFQLALSLSGYHRSLVGRTRMATICMSSLVRAPPKESKSCKSLQSGQKRKREPTYLDMSRKG